MILNSQVWKQTIEAAKTAAADSPAWLRAIDRAVVEIEQANYWSFTDGILTIISTTSGKRYVIGQAHDCPARGTCKHIVARRLMQRYFERMAAAEANHQEAIKPAPVAKPLRQRDFVNLLREEFGQPAVTAYMWLLANTGRTDEEGYAEVRDSYRAELAAKTPPVADERAQLMETIHTAWKEKNPGWPLGLALLKRFGVNQLEDVHPSYLPKIAVALQQ